MIEILAALSKGIGTTLAITGGAFVFGALLGVPLVLLRRSPFRPVRVLLTLVVELIRAVPPIVWLFLIYYGVSIGTFTFSTLWASILGLGLIAGAYLSETYRAALDSVASGQWEAARALGLKSPAIYLKVILPQAMLLTIAPAATFAIGLLKDSAVASVVGAVDVSYLSFQLSRQSNEGLIIFAVAAAIYLVLSLPIAMVARVGGIWIEKRLTS